MILVSHILIAVFSLILTSSALIKPGKKIIDLSYISTALTVVSGVAVIGFTSASLTHLCASGSVYIAIELFILNRAKNLVASKVTN